MTAVAELVTTPTLDELAARIRHEIQGMEDAANKLIDHAIAIGHALIAVKPLVSYGEYELWVERETRLSHNYAKRFVRLAEYEDAVRAAGAESIYQGMQAIKGLPAIALPGSETRQARKERIEALRAGGMTIRETAETVGLSVNMVNRILDPAYHERQQAHANAASRRRKAARKALRDREQEQAIRKALVNAGQAKNEAYKLATRLDQILGQCRSEAQSGEERIAINEAHAHRDKMMDAIIRALGVA